MIEGLVSVIIPIYNAEGTIYQALNSVRIQTYKNIEIIIINDGSNDKSEKEIEKFISKYRVLNIAYLKKSNSGVSSARNCGLRVAKGEYIAFLDADDEWLPQKIENQINLFIERKDVNIIGTSSLASKKNDIKTKKIEYITYNKMLFRNVFNTSGVVIRKKLLEDEMILFNENKSYSEDYEFYLKIIYVSPGLILNERTVKNSEVNDGLSSKLWLMEKGELNNYYLAYREKKISFIMYIVVSCFSIIKFFRRLILSRVRRWC